MTIFLETTIVDVGAEVPDLLAGNLLILYGLGAPPELAELSVLHAVRQGPAAEPPPVGATLTIGALTTRLTAIGDGAWRTVTDIGHVVLNFSGAGKAERSGELCAAPVDAEALAAALSKGAVITITAA